MKIKEVVERECCDGFDDRYLKRLRAPAMLRQLPKEERAKACFCIHCGQVWLDRHTRDSCGMSDSRPEYVMWEGA